MRWALAGMVLTFCGLPGVAHGHPVPFSYVDVRVEHAALDVTLVVHMFDVAHDLKVEPATQLLDPAFLKTRNDALISLITPRLRLEVDGRPVASAWSLSEILSERQSLKFHMSYPLAQPAGMTTIHARLFPYDPVHQTFLNIYDGDTLATQAILDKDRAAFEYFTGSRQGVAAVVRKFLPSGIHHILIGPDHLLFLVGLLLLGGTVRRLLLVVTAFTVAHSITLSLAALNLVTPSPRFVEPAIALTIVCVGADNLLVRGGRDLRAWLAFAFGLIHGFGFASVLREMGLPASALGWSLFSFNVGVEIGQLAVVIAVASLFAALRAWSTTAGQRLVFIGSVIVMTAGAFWFVQRVFFPGGLS